MYNIAENDIYIMKQSVFIIALLLLVVIAACSKKGTDITTTIDCSTVTYSAVIQPLVSSKCALSGCHASGSKNGDFTLYVNLFKEYSDGDLKNEVITRRSMPQNGALSDTELQQFQCWINNGAPEN
jgi:hypothetical protein